MGYKSKLGVVEALQEGDNLKVEIEWESDFSSEYYYFTRHSDGGVSISQAHVPAEVLCHLADILRSKRG